MMLPTDYKWDSFCACMKFINKDTVKEITEYEVQAPGFLQGQ